MEYLNILEDEDDKNKKIYRLNEIYFDELSIKPSTVKKALNIWIEKEKIQECNKIIDLSDSTSGELIEALKVFQNNKDLPSDGIFGYYTCERIKEYIK